MASIQINNFSVTVVTFDAVAGVDFTQNNPSVVLLLTPDSGYTLTATDFAATSPLPNYVSSAVFSQNGLNVNCVVNYISPSIMPATDILIDVCGTGFAVETNLTLSGTIKSCGISNVSSPAAGYLPSAYTGSGAFGTSAIVISQTVTASTGFYFDTEPSLSLTIGVIHNYTITSVKTYNTEGLLTQIIFTVNYTFPANNVTGDEFCLIARATSIYNPPTEIQSYSFNTSAIISSGETRTFTINGIEGANWNLVALANVGGANIVNTSGTIDSTGQAIVNVIFPLTTVDQSYTFTLTGNLASTFDTTGGQPSIFTVYQYISKTLCFAFTSTNSDITVGAADCKTFIPYSETPETYSYTVTATSTSNIVLLNSLPNGEWTNQNLLQPNFGQNVDKTATIINNTVTPKTLTANILVAIDFAGTTNLLSVFNLDSYVQGALVPVSLSFGSTATLACCTAPASNYFVASGQTFLTATSVLDASGNPAADGFYKQ